MNFFLLNITFLNNKTFLLQRYINMNLRSSDQTVGRNWLQALHPILLWIMDEYIAIWEKGWYCWVIFHFIRITPLFCGRTLQVITVLVMPGQYYFLLGTQAFLNFYFKLDSPISFVMFKIAELQAFCSRREIASSSAQITSTNSKEFIIVDCETK